MKESARQQFRWAPHTSGVMQVKPRDFEDAGEIEAASAYDAWMRLRGGDQALGIGDLLEAGTGELRICKYVGFEEARWIVPETRPAGAPPGVTEASAAVS
jgi:hypothetical protein